MEEVKCRAADLPWEQPSDYPSKLKRRVLRRGGDGMPRVALIKLEPGFEMNEHSHPFAENHYVIEGMYESHGHEYPAGTYRFLPAHSTHGPFRSRSGALILVSWEA